MEQEEFQVETAHGMVWDKPYYFYEGQKIIPKIFDDSQFSQMPMSFNSIKVKLDGKMLADLSWKKEIEQAEAAIKNGYFILWEIDLALFDRLKFPISHQGQYMSLGLSLEHFRDTVWKNFASNSLGLCVYRGPLDFSIHFMWDDQQLISFKIWIEEIFKNPEYFSKETGIPCSSFESIEPVALAQFIEGKRLVSLFCRDVSLDYLNLLTGRLPDTMARFLMLENSCSDVLLETQLLNPELYENYELVIKGSNLHWEGMGWNASSKFGYIAEREFYENQINEPRIGVCLPSSTCYLPSQYDGLNEALNIFLANNIPFRIISESRLMTNLDGLDYLVFVPAGLSMQGKRQLQGFNAAGGTPVTLGKKIGLPLEIAFENIID